MPSHRSLRLLVGVALFAVATSLDVRPARAGDEPWELDRSVPHPGVEITTMVRAQPPLVVHTVRVSSEAPVELRPVLASGAVGDETAGHGHETTSSMCDRAGGVVCVNADFNACPGCREPFGGVVSDGRVLRSFHQHHEQLSLVAGEVTTEPVRWSGVVRASYVWHQGDDPTTGLPAIPVRGSSVIDLAGLNVRAGGDALVAYTSEWGPAAPMPAGARHLSLHLTGPLVPGPLTVVSAELANSSPIPADAVVVVASGTAAEHLDRFWQEWLTTDADERALVIETATNRPVETSVGGHPVLLRGGQVLDLNHSDPKIRDRHPRTLGGRTAGGDLLLLTVDGRQPGHSQGITLVEAQHLLLSLGAVDGINLDGGGSSTFVTACHSGWCVRNRPSDGSERRVTVALALVAAPPAPVSAAADQPAPALAAEPVSLPGAANAPEPAQPMPAGAPLTPPSTASPSPVPPSGALVAATRSLAPVADGEVAPTPSAGVVAAISPPVGVAAPAARPRAAALPLGVIALGLWLTVIVALVARTRPRAIASSRPGAPR